MAKHRFHVQTQPIAGIGSSLPRHFANGLLASVFLLCALTFGQDAPFKISYISAELVYLDGGKDLGLTLGSRLKVVRDNRTIAELEVTHLSQNSSACAILSQQAAPTPGDTVFWIAPPTQPQPTTEAEPAKPSPPVAKPSSASKSVKPRKKRPDRHVRGTIAFQWFQFQDNSGFASDYDQPSLKISLRGQELMGGHYGFTIRTRTRQRANTRTDETEYQNRIYQAAFHYQNPNARINYSLGRLISDTFSGAGYIDGGLLEAKIGGGWKGGVFGGYQPEWQDSDLRTSTTKYGTYLNYLHGDFQTGRWSSTLGWSSAYHESEIDREFVFVQNRYSKGSKFQFYQSAELELNRGWREEKTGKSTELSSLYVFGRYQFTPGFRLGATFDDRQNYYTYELRNRDEQFFDDLARRGLRLDFQGQITKRLRISGYWGQRERKDDTEDSEFYNLYTYWRPKHLAGLTFGLRGTAFENPTTDGESGQLRVGRFFGQGRHMIYLSYADYQYNSKIDGSERNSQWLRLESYFTLGKKWYTSFEVEQSTGDDLDGLRILLALGYRL